MIGLCCETYCCYDFHSNKFRFTSKDLIKRTLEDSGDGCMSTYCNALEEVPKVTSTNRGFRTIQHAFATCEQTKKGL